MIIIINFCKTINKQNFNYISRLKIEIGKAVVHALFTAGAKCFSSKRNLFPANLFITLLIFYYKIVRNNVVVTAYLVFL